jgi:TolB protein
MWPALLLLSLAAAPLPAPSGQIAFMREGRVWIIGADGSGERALTGTLFYKTERPITWSPDGRRVLFWNHSKVGWDIWTVTVDGKESVNLTQVTRGGCRSPAPAPDGKRIAFLRDNPEGLYLMNADGSNQRRLTDKAFRDFLPTWSPDGKRIAYTLLEEGRFSISCYDLASRKDVRVVRGASSPAWSPDGSRLLFVRFQKKTVTLGLISPDGSNEVWLTKGPAEAWEPAWSPDGGRVAYFRPRNGKTELRVVTADGKTEKVLAAVDGRWSSSAPSWSPDGKWLTFAAGEGEKQVVYVVDDQGGSVRKLATGGACYPVWRPAPRDRGRP